MRKERMNAKVRDAQLQKVPYMLVVGDKEARGRGGRRALAHEREPWPGAAGGVHRDGRARGGRARP